MLIHGQRRWLVGKTSDLQKLAEKAAQLGGVAFERSTAYLFFEDKLNELKEEFGFDNFADIMQEPGDLLLIPKGYSTVSLSLQDSLSYREIYHGSEEQLERQLDAQLWQPPFGYDFAFCLDKKDLRELIGNEQGVGQIMAVQKEPAKVAGSWYKTLAVCDAAAQAGLSVQHCTDAAIKGCTDRLAKAGVKLKKKKDKAEL